MTQTLDTDLSTRKVNVAHSVRQIDQIFADRLFLLEQKLHGLETKTEEELKVLSKEVRLLTADLQQLGRDMSIAITDMDITTKSIHQVQQDYAPVMNSLTQVFMVGKVIKKGWMVVVSLLAAVGALAALWDQISMFF